MKHLIALLCVMTALSATAQTKLSPDSDKKAALLFEAALKYISSLKINSTSELFSEIFGGPTAADAASFLIKRVQRVYCYPEGNTSMSVASYGGNKAMSVDCSKVGTETDKLIIATIFLHEARHADVPYHVRCYGELILDRKPMNNQMGYQLACDDTVYGSYAAQYVFLDAVERDCKNCTEKTKYIANVFALNQTLPRFEDASLRRQLLEKTHADISKVENNAARTMDNKSATNLRFFDWFQQCEKDRSCY